MPNVFSFSQERRMRGGYYYPQAAPFIMKRIKPELVTTKRFKLGLVVGKFSIMHLGHEFLIESALAHCDKVIIISYSRPILFDCTPEKVAGWLSKFNARIIVLDLKKGYIPHNNAKGIEHCRFITEILDLYKISGIDAVFSSEDYGYGFADYLSNETNINVEHVVVDRKRLVYPISGTMVRDDVHKHREFLSPEVYKDFVTKAVFLGGESTGKSTLVKILGNMDDCVGVQEYGRELWENQKGILSYDDMMKIAVEQTRRDNYAMLLHKRYVFCDTSPLTTSMYSEFMFNKVSTRLRRLAECSIGSKKPDYIFLCAPDFEFVQDGTRVGDEFRMKQHEWYTKRLAPYGNGEGAHRYILLTGSIDDRVRKVKEVMGIN